MHRNEGMQLILYSVLHIHVVQTVNITPLKLHAVMPSKNLLAATSKSSKLYHNHPQ